MVDCRAGPMIAVRLGQRSAHPGTGWCASAHAAALRVTCVLTVSGGDHDVASHAKDVELVPRREL